MPQPSKKTSEWLKEIDVSRSVENMLVGLIIFVGRFFKTFFIVLSKPQFIENDLIFNSEYKNYSQVNFTRPISFLVVSGFIYLGFTLPTIGQLIPIEQLLDDFKWLIDRLPKKIEEMTLEKIATFMVPFLLFAALYALIQSTVSKVFSTQSHFKTHLNITAYICGSYAVVSSIVAITLPPLWELSLSNKNSVMLSLPLLASGIMYLVAMLGCTARYIYFVHRAQAISWLKAMTICAITLCTFLIVMYALLFLLRPFLAKLE